MAMFLLESSKNFYLSKIDEISFLSQYLSYRYQVENPKNLVKKF